MNLMNSMNSIYYPDNMNIDMTTIMKIKKSLMIDDVKTNMDAIMWIKGQLNISSNRIQRLLFNEKLISSDIALVLCDILGSSQGEIFTSTLNIVANLRKNKKFYDCELAKKAIQSIFRKFYFMNKKPENHEDELSSVTWTVCMILDGAVEINYPIWKIEDPNNIILFLKDLKSSSFSKYKLRWSAGKLLCLIAKVIDADDPDAFNAENLKNLFSVFEDSILSIGMIIDKHKCKNDSWLHFSLGLICSICSVGTRFCNDGYDAQTTEIPQTFDGTTFTKMITEIMMKTVLPLFKEMSFEREELESNRENMVKCLDHLMQLKCCNTDELTKTLVKNGYLEYLLAISINSSIRDSACSLVSEVVAYLSRDSFPTEDTVENRIQFRNYIYEGIVDSELAFYIHNFTILENYDGISSDVLTIIMYYHFRETADYSILQLPPIIKKLLSVTRQQPIIVLKSIWLLFAASWTKYTEPQSVSSCEDAVKHLATLLGNRELEKLYTHHETIIEYCIVCEDFSIELQQEIIRLWINFNGESKNLLRIGKFDLIADCFVKFVETGPENFIARALECIEELKKEKLVKDRIDVVIWEALSRIVASHIIIGKIENAKGILKLSAEANIEKWRNIDEIDGQSVVALVNMLIAQALDNELKTLFITYIHKLLEVSLVRGNTKVIKTCLADSEFVRSLKDTALSRQDNQLAAVSLNVLILIIECQSKFCLQCNVEGIVRLEPIKMLVLLARTSYSIFHAAMRLLLLLLNRDNAVVEPIVSFCHFEDETEARKTIFGWYRQLHLLHSRARMEDWNIVFRCLTAVLHYCADHEFRKLLRDLCDYSGTYGVIDWTIERRYSDAPFSEFVQKWVRYGVQCKVWKLNTVDKSQENVFGPTRFEETITRFMEFMNK